MAIEIGADPFFKLRSVRLELGSEPYYDINKKCVLLHSRLLNIKRV